MPNFANISTAISQMIRRADPERYQDDAMVMITGSFGALSSLVRRRQLSIGIDLPKYDK
jgi:hypothetical protein